MNKNGNKPERLSPIALEVLQRLQAAAELDAPFQPLDDVNKVVRTSLVKRDLIFESAGLDGSVKYKITGRGEKALGNHTLDLSNAHKQPAAKRLVCEECLHRTVLDCIRERLPLVDALQAALEALEQVQVTGSARDKLARIQEINAYAAQIEAVLTEIAHLADRIPEAEHNEAV